MQRDDLFPSTAHDPGGKVRTRLPAGMTGGATFCGPGDCYRTLLWRSWGPEDAAAALFIGMNPSTADAMLNDPTITREVGFTRSWGMTRYYKANVSAYRATDPKRLAGAPIDCPENVETILGVAVQVARVVMACGALSGPMLALFKALVRDLTEWGVPLWCLGTTKGGFPRHPLYLASATPLEPWDAGRLR